MNSVNLAAFASRRRRRWWLTHHSPQSIEQLLRLLQKVAELHHHLSLVLIHVRHAYHFVSTTKLFRTSPKLVYRHGRFPITPYSHWEGSHHWRHHFTGQIWFDCDGKCWDSCVFCLVWGMRFCSDHVDPVVGEALLGEFLLFWGGGVGVGRRDDRNGWQCWCGGFNR